MRWILGFIFIELLVLILWHLDIIQSKFAPSYLQGTWIPWLWWFIFYPLSQLLIWYYFLRAWRSFKFIVSRARGCCPHCNSHVQDDDSFCENCGGDIKNDL
jgi:hypothetical protein